MEKTECNKQLRTYAGQLAERLGLKVNISKVKDTDLLAFVIGLRSKWEGIETPFKVCC